jgi:hypothetical protein
MADDEYDAKCEAQALADRYGFNREEVRNAYAGQRHLLREHYNALEAIEYDSEDAALLTLAGLWTACDDDADEDLRGAVEQTLRRAKQPKPMASP